MNRPRNFEERLRQGEYFHGVRLLPRTWAVIRLDGRGFTKMTANAGYEKPFDLRLSERMADTASTVFEELGGVFGYTESDEISLLFPPDWDLFDRELEKLVSVSAGLASSRFTAIDPGVPGHFDSRIWLGVELEEVLDYFRWRQADASRGCINAWCYWTLRKEGRSVADATSELDGKDFPWKNEFLFQRGVNFNEIPAWQRRGTGLYWKHVEKVGVDPRTGTEVTALRRRLHVDRELPMKDELDQFLKALLTT